MQGILYFANSSSVQYAGTNRSSGRIVTALFVNLYIKYLNSKDIYLDDLKSISTIYITDENSIK